MADDDISLLIQKFDKDGNSLFDKVVPSRSWLLSMSCRVANVVLCATQMHRIHQT